jgi:HD-GYP domain-containing protein (c-di-GMP phosphodiesterase class II)
MIRAINIEKVEPGMFLGQTICDENGRKLVLKDKELTEFSIEKLKELGFNFIYVEDKIGEEFQNKDVFSDELKRKMSDDLKRLDITSTIENAKSIVETICNNYHNIFDTIDVRNNNDYLFKHSIMVAEFSIAIGMKLNLKQQELVNLTISALLHDIGKLCINKEMLDKIKINDKELMYQEKFHPFYAYSLLSKMPEISATTKSAILFHHKNENGTGFPENIKIPDHIFYKILHVADAYDNLISSKNGMNPSDALEYLYANSGTLFNVDVVNAFKSCIPIYPRGIEVKLSNGLDGVVIDNTNDKSRPKVKVLIKGTNVVFDLRKYLDVTITDIKLNDNIKRR